MLDLTTLKLTAGNLFEPSALLESITIGCRTAGAGVL